MYLKYTKRCDLTILDADLFPEDPEINLIKSV